MANLILEENEFNQLFNLIAYRFKIDHPTLDRTKNFPLWLNTVSKCLGGQTERNIMNRLMKFGKDGKFDPKIAKQFPNEHPNLSLNTLNAFCNTYKIYLDGLKSNATVSVWFVQLDQFSKMMSKRFSELRKERENALIIKCEIRKSQNSLHATQSQLNSIDGVNLSRVEHTVVRFYKNISSQKYKLAWEILDSKFKNREAWGGKYEKFEKGFTNTLALKDITVLENEELVSGRYKTKVYYEDVILLHTSKEIRGIQSCNGHDNEMFEIYYQALKKKIEEYGGMGFDTIPLKKLFEPAATEYIWYACGFEPSQVEKIFNITENIKAHRVVTCFTSLSDDDVFITDIVRHAVESVT